MDDTVLIPASIDIETTGLDPDYHEIVQVSVVTFDKHYKPLEAFTEYIKPDHPERMTREALEINKIDPKTITEDKSKDAIKNKLISWIEDQNCDIKVKLAPLGHNYSVFDLIFLKKWLQGDYNKNFDYHIIDTYQIANILRDAGIIDVESCSLASLCSYLKIENPGKHNAYYDALYALEVYQRLIKKFNMANLIKRALVRDMSKLLTEGHKLLWNWKL